MILSAITVRIYFEFEYEDGKSFSFYGDFEGSEGRVYGEILMVTKGTLMASRAVKATAYNLDGSDVVKYTK